MASLPERFGGHSSTAVYAGQQRRNTALPLMRAPRMSADEFVMGAIARAGEKGQQSRFVGTGTAERIEDVGGSVVEYVDSDGEGYGTEEDETSALVERTASSARAEGKGKGSWFRRRATVPKRKSSKQWFRRQSASRFSRLQSHASPVPGTDEGLGVDHIEDAEEWRERMQGINTSDKKAGGMRKFSKRLSSGASSVKSFGKKCASKVRKYWRVDSAVVSPQHEDAEALLALHHIHTPYPFSAPPDDSPDTEPRGRSLRRLASALTINHLSPKARQNPQRRLDSRTTATDTYRTTSLAASFKSGDDPAKYDLQAKALWLNEFEYWFSIHERKGRFWNAARERYFDRVVGNCTSEAQQWAASNSHQQRAERERMEREVMKLKVQKRAKDGHKAIRGSSIPYRDAGEGEGPRLRKMPSRRTAVSIASVVGEAMQRCGHGLV